LRTIQKKLNANLSVKIDSDNELHTIANAEPLTKDEKKQIKDIKGQLKSKTIELAKIAKENDEKGQILNEVKEKVNHCVQHPESIHRVAKDILAMLDSVIISHDPTFEIQLDELHQEFSKKLRVKYPDLTTHDLRLATYIKIGLNSKEIADLLNIKPSSVYISRSRLRKKIDLDTDADLHGYLNSI
jgi:DNA-binding CsgD family transcriptional regulator